MNVFIVDLPNYAFCCFVVSSIEKFNFLAHVEERLRLCGSYLYASHIPAHDLRTRLCFLPFSHVFNLEGRFSYSHIKSVLNFHIRDAAQADIARVGVIEVKGPLELRVGSFSKTDCYSRLCIVPLSLKFLGSDNTEMGDPIKGEWSGVIAVNAKSFSD